MYEATALLVVGLTIAALWLRNVLLMLSGGLAWVLWGVLMANVGTGAGEPFEGNTFLPQAFLALGSVLAIVCFASALIQFMSTRRKERMSGDEDYKSYKNEVLKATGRKPR